MMSQTLYHPTNLVFNNSLFDHMKTDSSDFMLNIDMIKDYDIVDQGNPYTKKSFSSDSINNIKKLNLDFIQEQANNQQKTNKYTKTKKLNNIKIQKSPKNQKVINNPTCPKVEKIIKKERKLISDKNIKVKLEHQKSSNEESHDNTYINIPTSTLMKNISSTLQSNTSTHSQAEIDDSFHHISKQNNHPLYVKDEYIYPNIVDEINSDFPAQQQNCNRFFNCNQCNYNQNNYENNCNHQQFDKQSFHNLNNVNNEQFQQSLNASYAIHNEESNNSFIQNFLNNNNDNNIFLDQSILYTKQEANLISNNLDRNNPDYLIQNDYHSKQLDEGNQLYNNQYHYTQSSPLTFLKQQNQRNKYQPKLKKSLFQLENQDLSENSNSYMNNFNKKEKCESEYFQSTYKQNNSRNHSNIYINSNNINHYSHNIINSSSKNNNTNINNQINNNNSVNPNKYNEYQLSNNYPFEQKYFTVKQENKETYDYEELPSYDYYQNQFEQSEKNYYQDNNKETIHPNKDLLMNQQDNQLDILKDYEEPIDLKKQQQLQQDQTLKQQLIANDNNQIDENNIYKDQTTSKQYKESLPLQNLEENHCDDLLNIYQLDNNILNLSDYVLDDFTDNLKINKYNANINSQFILENNNIINNDQTDKYLNNNDDLDIHTEIVAQIDRIESKEKSFAKMLENEKITGVYTSLIAYSFLAFIESIPQDFEQKYENPKNSTNKLRFDLSNQLLKKENEILTKNVLNNSKFKSQIVSVLIKIIPVLAGQYQHACQNILFYFSYFIEILNASKKAVDTNDNTIKTEYIEKLYKSIHQQFYDQEDYLKVPIQSQSFNYLMHNLSSCLIGYFFDLDIQYIKSMLI